MAGTPTKWAEGTARYRLQYVLSRLLARIFTQDRGGLKGDISSDERTERSKFIFPSRRLLPAMIRSHARRQFGKVSPCNIIPGELIAFADSEMENDNQPHGRYRKA